MMGVATSRHLHAQKKRKSARPASELLAAGFSRPFSSLPVASSVAGCGDSRPHPTTPARHKLIEVRRIVVRDSACQHKSFPRARRNLKPLQLANHFQRPMLAAHLRTRSNMLPAQKASS